jgi:hypothetical protein
MDWIRAREQIFMTPTNASKPFQQEQHRQYVESSPTSVPKSTVGHHQPFHHSHLPPTSTTQNQLDQYERHETEHDYHQQQQEQHNTRTNFVFLDTKHQKSQTNHSTSTGLPTSMPVQVSRSRSTAPISIPSTNHHRMPSLSTLSEAIRRQEESGGVSSCSVDDSAQLERQIQYQRHEMQHRVPLQQLGTIGSSSTKQQRPLFLNHAFTYSETSGFNPLKTPPTVPPISPFAGLALSAPTKSTIGSNMGGSFPRQQSTSSYENSPRLPSLNIFRASSPGMKMGIMSRPPQPPPLNLRSTSSSSQEIGLPSTSYTPTKTSRMSSSSFSVPAPSTFCNSKTTSSTYLSPRKTSVPFSSVSSFSQSLPTLSMLRERRASRVSFDSTTTETTAAAFSSAEEEEEEEEEDKDSIQLSSSVGSNMTSRTSRICRFTDCTNIARSRGLCRSHGGGKRCSHPNCTKSAQANRKCIAHGGGTPCSYPDCGKTAQSRGLCKAHGGGARCKHPDCPKSSQSRGLCRGHGGGIKCKIDGCEKWVQKNGYCIKHGKEHSAQ